LELCAGRPRLRAGGFSQLKLSEKQATVVVTESNFVIERSRPTEFAEAHFAPQCFPTLRTVTQLGNRQYCTKTRAKRACVFTEISKKASLLMIRDAALLKSRASRQEKLSGCNGNGATADVHIPNVAVLQSRPDVNAAWTKHLDALFEDDRLTACRQRMPHEIRGGAS
jgi:hypothetical protein